MKTSLLLALATLTLGAPTLAQGTAPGPTATAAPLPAPASDAEKKVCRRDVATGSMMVKRTCHSKAEWAAIDQANQASAEAIRDRSARNGQ